MDGCRSHRRAVVKPPARTERRQVLLDWLKEHNVPLPPSTRAKGPTKVQLHAKIKEMKEDHTRYASWDIARGNGGHHIHVTPPYHPELQPIERVWAVLKNAFADLPKTEEEKKSMKFTVTTMKDLWDNKISPETVKGAWEKLKVSMLQFLEEADEDFELDDDDDDVLSGTGDMWSSSDSDDEGDESHF